MKDEERDLSKRISVEELEDEELTVRLSKAEKKARIRELKKDYGPGWKKALSWIKSIRVDKEATKSMFGDSRSLRDYNDPRTFRR